jgi:antitoxin (DNA-binding transcriptional repressor) of toxin-antitoxin stability system
MCHIEHMPSVNIRELRNTKQLKQWLRSGKKVELRDRNEIIGEIVPKNRRKSPAQWPDFDALAKEIIGDRILSGSDLLIEERGRD